MFQNNRVFLEVLFRSCPLFSGVVLQHLLVFQEVIGEGLSGDFIETYFIVQFLFFDHLGASH